MTFHCQIKKEYSIVKAIREQLGFGWDDTLKIATAPEDVWETYIAVCNPIFTIPPVY